MLDFLAAGSGGSAAPALMQFLPIIGMILIFWFLLFRPQMKRHKEHQAKIAPHDIAIAVSGIGTTNVPVRIRT